MQKKICGFVRTKSLSKGDICGFAWNIVGGLRIIFVKKELAKITDFLKLAAYFVWRIFKTNISVVFRSMTEIISLDDKK